MRSLIALGFLTMGSSIVYQFGSQFQGEIWRVVVGMVIFGLMGLVLGSVADNLLLLLTRLTGRES
ncbi:MAG: hypothetical protein NZ805_07990 [Armatimonadetes bacterium]|nr:hypothetical protein [Armatimonadota bacterium]